MTVIFIISGSRGGLIVAVILFRVLEPSAYSSTSLLVPSVELSSSTTTTTTTLILAFKLSGILLSRFKIEIHSF